MSLANKVSSIRWNAFMGRDSPSNAPNVPTFSMRPDINYDYQYKDRSIIVPMINRIALDAASIDVKHVITDTEGNYLTDVKSWLNMCITLSANLDQTARAFWQDHYFSLLDEGCDAICPVDTDDDPNKTNGFTIYNLRVGKIVNWSAQKVQVRLYDERDGNKYDIWYDKSAVAIVENPFFPVMNASNSTLKRLARKTAILDKIDSDASKGRLDLIIQLPYLVKTQARKRQAEERRADIERQLANSKYGIAYTDATEKVTQLNRPIENTLPDQIKELTAQLQSQMYMDETIMNGTADEKTMNNYYKRVIEVLVAVTVDEMNRKFFTKTARTQGHCIKFFRDPLELISAEGLANIADSYTRNAIATSNEIRQKLGFKPSEQPIADQLSNKNLYDEGFETGAESEEPNDGYTDDDIGFH